MHVPEVCLLFYRSEPRLILSHTQWCGYYCIPVGSTRSCYCNVERLCPGNYLILLMLPSVSSSYLSRVRRWSAVWILLCPSLRTRIQGISFPSWTHGRFLI